MSNIGPTATKAGSAAPVHPKLDLDGWWWAMVGLGFLIIGFFGFFVCIETRHLASGAAGWPNLWPQIVAPARALQCFSHWRSWEMGAVIWSVFFGIYYFVRFPLPKESSVKFICFLVFVGATIPNMLAAYYILTVQPALYHVLCVIVGALLFMLADFCLFISLKHHRERGSFLEALLMADLPVVVGLSVLLLYLRVHSGHGDSREMEAFAGGAISFQLIASNVIFILSQGGFIRWVWESHVPKYIHEIQVEPEPWLLHLLAGVALMFGLCGVTAAVVRRFDGSGSPWLWLAGLVMLIAALGAGLFGRRLARRLARSGTGPCNSALGLGAAGLLCLAFFTPPYAVSKGNTLRQLANPLAGGARVAAVALSPDGGRVAIGSDTDDTVKVLHTGIGTQDADLTLSQGGPVLALAFSADGKQLASGGRGLSVVVWDMETGKRLRTVGGRREDSTDTDVLCLVFSPDGRMLAGGTRDGTVRLWDTASEDGEASGEPRLTLKEDAPVRALAFSADGHWLAGGREASRVFLRQIHQWWVQRDDEERRQLERVEVDKEKTVGFGGFGDREVSSLVVSAQGERVAAGFDDGSVRLWERTDPGSWAQPKEMEKPGGRPVLAQFFSEETGVLASASAASVMLWDTRSGTTRSLPWTAQAATAMAFSADGRVVANGSDVGTVSVYQPH